MLGVILLLTVAGSGWIDQQAGLRELFNHPGLPLAFAIIGYGFAAGALPPDKAAVALQLNFSQQLDAMLALLFAALLWLIVIDMLHVCARHLQGKRVPQLSEAPHYPSRLEETWVRD